jgi:hypothetical protein
MKHSFIRHFTIKEIHFRTYRTRILVSFLVCALIPLVTLVIVFYLSTSRISKSKVIDSMQHTSSATALSIENRFRQMENIADAIQ